MSLFLLFLFASIFVFGVAQEIGKRVDKDWPSNLKNGVPYLVGGFILLLCYTFNPFYVVEGGHRGVVKKFGAIQTEELKEGLNFTNPFVDTIEQWDVRVFKFETKSSVVSSDIQPVTAISALNYHIDPDKVADLVKIVSGNITQNVIVPAMEESLKTVTAKYAVQDLINKREIVRDEVRSLISKKLAKYYLIVDDYSIVNFDFSDKFTKSVEEKQISEQRSQQAKYELEKVKIDSEQAIARAKAEAEGLRMQKEQITPELLELRRIEMQKAAIDKWNGDVPQYMVGNNTPFINLNTNK